MAQLIASWQSVKPEENRFRHYSLTLSRDLWSREVLVKRWGRIGHRKVEGYYRPDNHQDLLEEIKKIVQLRMKHDYQLTSTASLFNMLKNDKK